MVKCEQRLLGQSHEELNREERITSGLLMHKLRERLGNFSLAVKRIVEEQGERVFGPSEHIEESPKHQLEACLPVLRREVGNRRLLTDDEGKLRDQVDHELAVRAKRLQQCISPAVQLRIIRAEQLMH